MAQRLLLACVLSLSAIAFTGTQWTPHPAPIRNLFSTPLLRNTNHSHGCTVATAFLPARPSSVMKESSVSRSFPVSPLPPILPFLSTGSVCCLPESETLKTRGRSGRLPWSAESLAASVPARKSAFARFIFPKIALCMRARRADASWLKQLRWLGGSRCH